MPADRHTALRVVIISALMLLSAFFGAPVGWAQNEQQNQQQNTASPTAIPASRKANRVAVLPITGAIDDVTLWSLERRLRAAREQGYDAVVLELDTPGGEVTATIDICLRIRTEAPENTVAWIHPKAFSAGTFIALACREIVVAPGSTFGDAAPIAVLPGLGLSPLPAAERAKMESPLLDELDASAERRGDDPRLLHAFVVTERELWVIERKVDGVQRFADRMELEALGLDPTKVPPRPKADRATPSRPRSSAEIPLNTDSLDADDRGAWALVELVDDATRLLVVQPDEALRWGLATSVVANDAELAQYFGATTVTRFPESFWESAVRFLVSWPIRILLIAVLVVSLVIEGLHPGIGIAGGVAAAALLLLIGAPSLLGLAEWWEILLVLAGIVLIAVEVLVTPGIGFVGLAGALCILFGLVASFTGSDPTSANERSALLTATTTTVAGLVAGGLLTWFASRWFRETSLFRGAVLSASIGRAHEQPIRGETPIPPTGTIGVADSDLRPAGRVRCGRDLIDAQSTGDYLARGTRVIIVGRVGASVIVEAHDPSGSPATSPTSPTSPFDQRKERDA